MNFKKGGGIATVVAVILGVMILSSIFYHHFFVNIDLVRYNIMNQYARDVLLVCETLDEIDKTYILDTKTKLSNQIVKKTSEYVKIYITVNNNKYDADMMPSKIKTDFGEKIEIRIEYYYEPQRIDFKNGLSPQKVQTELELMGVDLKTISKNRGTSDG